MSYQVATKKVILVILSAAKNLDLDYARFFTPLRSIQNDSGQLIFSYLLLRSLLVIRVIIFGKRYNFQKARVGSFFLQPSQGSGC